MLTLSKEHHVHARIPYVVDSSVLLKVPILLRNLAHVYQIVGHVRQRVRSFAVADSIQSNRNAVLSTFGFLRTCVTQFRFLAKSLSRPDS